MRAEICPHFFMRNTYITLDEDTLRRYGKQLYVIGDVIIPEDADALDEVKYLNIRGDVKVPQEHKEKLLRVLTGISGEIKIAKRKHDSQNQITCQCVFYKSHVQNMNRNLWTNVDENFCPQKSG